MKALETDTYNETLLYGSRWRCINVQHSTKLGSRSELVLVIAADVEQSEVSAAAAEGGPGALLGLLAIPGAQLQGRIERLEKQLAEMTTERDVLERVLGKREAKP